MADLAPLSTAIDAASLGGAIDGAAPRAARSVCGARAPGSRCVCGVANRCERVAPCACWATRSCRYPTCPRIPPQPPLGARPQWLAEGDGLLPRVDDQPTVTEGDGQ